MNTFELVALVVFALLSVAGMSAALYLFLPPAAFESAARHGRYAGLGTRSGRSGSSGRPATMRSASIALAIE